ncbi:MAG: ROK family protein [Dysgonamonadaceae bacterium]|jgi:glucokinase|nr:ROK family protein [Dysgonamonadaceae bacterium]
MNGSYYVIGIDMGGTNTALGVVDARGRILYRGKISTTDYSTGEEYAEALGNAINNLIVDDEVRNKIKGIGMGVPNGNMNDGTIEKAANIPWAKTVNVPIAAMITAKTGFPCKLTNDANAAALGEMIYGSAKGMKDFIVITLGTGLGSGIVSNGQLVVGHDGFAGELGHVTMVRHNGRLCGCGRTGCLETYASATGVAKTAREFLDLNPEKNSVLREIIYRPITSKDVFEAAKKGDELAIDVFNFTGKILGEALCDFVTYSSPQAIILFGGLAHSGDFLLKPLQEAMDNHILNVFKGKTRIIISQLNDAEAAILGASALAWEEQ